MSVNEKENTDPAVLKSEAEMAIEIVASFRTKILDAQKQTAAAIEKLKKDLNNAEANALALRAQEALAAGIDKALQQTFNKDTNEPTTGN